MNPLPTPNRFRRAALAATATLAVSAGAADARADAATSSEAAEAQGRQILAEALDAHGGLDRFRTFGTVTYETAGLPYSANAPLDFKNTTDLVVRHHRMQGHSAVGAFVTGSNAMQGWASDLDALGIPPRWVNHGQSYFVLMPFVFADPGAHVRALGERTFDGQTFDTIAVRYGEGTGDTFEDDYILYIDQDTRRLRLIDFSVTYGPMRGDTPIDQLPRRSLEFVEWQQADGLLVPAVLHYAPWQRTADGGNRAEAGVRYTITNYDFNLERPDATLFAAPPGATIE